MVKQHCPPERAEELGVLLRQEFVTAPASSLRTDNIDRSSDPPSEPIPTAESKGSQQDQVVAALRRSRSLAEAIASVRPLMGMREGVDYGGMYLSAWIDVHLQWNEFGTIPQTSVRAVLKDPLGERGKLLCVSGSVVEIRVNRDFARPFFLGTLATQGLLFVTFVAVRSTDGVVADTTGVFCGIATGDFTYTNMAGGRTTSALAVGMFDLPQNHGAPAHLFRQSDDH
ncbi:MAG: hypothetical protein R3B89_23595 [Polyangiaceae bacterium]